MNVENSKSQMRKGMLEYCILLLLRQQPAYANEIISRLKEADMIVVEGTRRSTSSTSRGRNWHGPSVI